VRASSQIRGRVVGAAKVRLLRADLLRWYRKNRRDLPWRKTTDPYRIWISETMLQQTRVSVVVPYYEKFTARFPDAVSLASASVDEVLACWAGLGYYRRARLLKRAAEKVARDYGGLLAGRDSATTGEPVSSSERPRRSRGITEVRFPTRLQPSRIFPESGATRPGRSSRSPSDARRRSWTETSSGFFPVSSLLKDRGAGRPTGRFSGRSQKRSFRKEPRAISTKR